MTYSFLQHYWWFIVSLLAGILVFLMFVQGGQSMIRQLGKTEDQRKLLINTIGSKWEFTFTTLVTFGGAFFASFPLFYSTSFGGAYWVWMLLLFVFIIQAVSYEYQSKPGNVFGKETYRTFLFINGTIAPFVIGVAVATFFTGSLFSVGKENILGLNGVGHAISRWEHPLYGLEALFNLRNLLLGFAVLFLARTLAGLYFVNRLNDAALEANAKKASLRNGAIFVVFFLAFLIWTLFADGFAVNPETQQVYLEKMKYLNNFIQMPVVLIVFLIGVVLVLFGIIKTYMNAKFKNGIWFAGVGTVLTVTMLLLVAGYNNTAYYPSVYGDMSSSLTIENSSSSEFTLMAMTIVSILIPFVLAYIFYAWRSLEKKRMSVEDIKSEPHSY